MASLNYECKHCRLWCDPLAWNKIAQLKARNDNRFEKILFIREERDEARRYAEDYRHRLGLAGVHVGAEEPVPWRP